MNENEGVERPTLVFLSHSLLATKIPPIPVDSNRGGTHDIRITALHSFRAARCVPGLDPCHSYTSVACWPHQGLSIRGKQVRHAQA